jgi:beta-phosphoglucomutase
VLEALSASHIFQSIVSAEDVHRGKPDPEVYLLAASRVGVAAERCIVVEDTSVGIEGGRRAAMRSIGVSHNGKDLHADLVVQSLELLEPNAFDRLLGHEIMQFRYGIRTAQNMTGNSESQRRCY